MTDETQEPQWRKVLRPFYGASAHREHGEVVDVSDPKRWRNAPRLEQQGRLAPLARSDGDPVRSQDGRYWVNEAVMEATGREAWVEGNGPRPATGGEETEQPSDGRSPEGEGEGEPPAEDGQPTEGEGAPDGDEDEEGGPPAPTYGLRDRDGGWYDVVPVNDEGEPTGDPVNEKGLREGPATELMDELNAQDGS